MDKYKLSVDIEISFKRVYQVLKSGLKEADTLIEAIKYVLNEDYGTILGSSFTLAEQIAVCMAFIEYIHKNAPGELLSIKL